MAARWCCWTPGRADGRAAALGTGRLRAALGTDGLGAHLRRGAAGHGGCRLARGGDETVQKRAGIVVVQRSAGQRQHRQRHRMRSHIEDRAPVILGHLGAFERAGVAQVQKQDTVSGAGVEDLHRGRVRAARKQGPARWRRQEPDQRIGGVRDRWRLPGGRHGSGQGRTARRGGAIFGQCRAGPQHHEPVGPSHPCGDGIDAIPRRTGDHHAAAGDGLGRTARGLVPRLAARQPEGCRTDQRPQRRPHPAVRGPCRHAARPRRRDG